MANILSGCEKPVPSYSSGRHGVVRSRKGGGQEEAEAKRMERAARRLAQAEQDDIKDVRAQD